MARQNAPRVRRLPQRLDWKLIPAPLDLSLPLATEKSPLPAIIVTPSSPSCETDFSIAFLAPPPKPTIRERIMSPLSANFPSPSVTGTFPFPNLASAASSHPRTRTTIILLLLMFIMACHVLTHRLAARRPHIDFSPAEFSAPGRAQVFEWEVMLGGGKRDEERSEFVVDERDVPDVEDLNDSTVNESRAPYSRKARHRSRGARSHGAAVL